MTRARKIYKKYLSKTTISNARNSDHDNHGQTTLGGSLAREQTTPFETTGCVEDNEIRLRANTSEANVGNIFPWWTPFLVWIITIVARILYVRSPGNWWILHPDEIFQSLEVAHTQVYGYGFRPYEFSTLPKDVNSTVSSYRQRELELGMYGMRSALYPDFYVMVSWVAAMMGFPDVKPFALWKTAHAVVSSCLPLSVYYFAGVVFSSHDAACLASVLIASSSHLNVLGTHTLLNSFLAPPVFCGLACLVPLLRAKDNSDEEVVSGGSVGGTNDNESRSNLKAAGKLGEKQAEDPQLFLNATKVGGGQRETNHQNVVVKVARTFLGAFLVSVCSYTRADLLLLAVVVLLPRARLHEIAYPFLPACFTGAVLGVLVGATADFRFYGELVVSPANWLRFNVLSDVSNILFGRSVSRKYLAVLFADGAMMLICNLLNVLVAVAFAICQFRDYFFAFEQTVLRVPEEGALSHCGSRLRNSNNCTPYSCISCGNYDDSSVAEDFSDLQQIYHNGRLVARTLNHEKHFNPCRNEQTKIVAEQSGSFSNHDHHSSLARKVHVQSRGRKSVYTNENQNGFAVVWLTLSWAVLLFMYTLKPHKELRFIHNVIVLMLVATAGALMHVVRVVGPVLNIVYKNIGEVASLDKPKTNTNHRPACEQNASDLCQKRKGTKEKTFSGSLGNILLFLFIAVWVGDQWRQFPIPKDPSKGHWAYQSSFDSIDVNACLAYVSGRDDVKGVFMDSNLHASGAYSLLHRDVPIFTFLEYEFVEFDSSKFKVTTRHDSAMVKGRPVSFFSMDTLSNLVSVQNAPYAVKLLVESAQYNYVLLSNDRQFIEVGFQQVFTHGTMRVLLRGYDPGQERQLQTLTAQLPEMGTTNSTVLKYEGDVLYRFGRFQLALKRYGAAMKVDSKNPELLRAVVACLLRLGKRVEADSWSKKCAQMFGVERCRRPLTFTNINPERHLF